MDFEDIRLMSVGFQPSQLLLTALDVGLFDHLAEQDASSEGIAASLHLDPRATEIICNALVALRLLEKAGNAYRNTFASSSYLVSTSSEFKGQILRHIGAMWEDWQQLPEIWREGKISSFSINQSYKGL